MEEIEESNEPSVNFHSLGIGSSDRASKFLDYVRSPEQELLVAYVLSLR